jgi:hypothetical protein
VKGDDDGWSNEGPRARANRTRRRSDARTA